ncbi:hypothetical protein [Algoriphagus mannitolivorans]|uniref:hypothetical protein n=1 Tax=Algoriphagus mannitolivorans TaxID=226504 RepID=UPI0012F7B528|nr:hypothetical protein [Algoriphagus mannitolivorans]
MKNFVRLPIRYVLGALLALWGINSAQAQHHELTSSDTSSSKKMFGTILNSGKFEFHLRSYFMMTENEPGLLDYSTWGTGAGLGYFSPRWKGIGIGFSGFFVFRHFENNITLKDPVTGLSNRYELTLYDVHHPENSRDMDRLEEFFISYEHEKFSAEFGRQHFESPLLNASDNRLRPNLFSGISARFHPEKWTITGSWFTHLISRGSLEWVPVEESVGFYSTGRNPSGSTETYTHHLNSKGIGVFGVEYKESDFSLKLWSYLAEGILATSFVEGVKMIALKNETKAILGIQGFYQTALGDGGNPDPEKAYTLPGEKTFGIGLRSGILWGSNQFTLNYLGISDQGRFLFPREWGREQFFVSMQRERYEGLGGVHGVNLMYEKTVHEHLKLALGAGHVYTPDLENTVLNKYGLPDYFHFTGLIDYRFGGFFKGLDLQFLLAYKGENTGPEVPKEYVINRVNMANLNLILDYRF